MKRSMIILPTALLIVVGAYVVMNQPNPQLVALEKQCVALSQNSEHEYVMVSGELIKINKYDVPSDCFDPSGCQEKLYPSVYTWVLTKTNIADTKSNISFRLSNPEDGVMSKVLAATKLNKNYAFCGRLKKRSNPKSSPVFRVDYPETIQEIAK